MSRILIVEDEAIIAKDLQRTLKGMGYDVPEPIARGPAAVEAAHRLRPDVILMDIHLAGDMDGTEAARFIAEHGDPAIIFLTAYADEETVERAQQATPYGYLVKPFDDATLRTTITTALRKRAMDQKQNKELQFQKEVLKKLPQAILLADEASTISYANPAARAALGDVENESLTALLDLDDVGTLWQRLLDRQEAVGWRVNGRESLLSAHRIGDRILVVLSNGPDRGAHEEAAAEAMNRFQSRLRELL